MERELQLVSQLDMVQVESPMIDNRVGLTDMACTTESVNLTARISAEISDFGMVIVSVVTLTLEDSNLDNHPPELILHLTYRTQQ